MTPRQREEVRAQNRPNAALIHETIRSEGVGELERRPSALAWSGLAAGLSIGFSMVVQGTLYTLLPVGPWRDTLCPLGYSIGFLIVVLGRQQLFTENTLTPVLPFLHDRTRTTLVRLLRLWLVVLASNVVGAWLFAWVAAQTSIFEPNQLHAFNALGEEAINAAFVPTMLRAVLAGWLIAMMVWLLPAAESARVLVIIILTYVIALGRFPHIVAGSVECAFLVLTGHLELTDFFTRFFVPTLIGNMVGGIALVAMLNYSQVAAEIDTTD